MNPNESELERCLGEAVRKALPPLPDDLDPAQIDEAFFAALAVKDAAAGRKPPDVADRLVAFAKRAAASRRPPQTVRRPPFRRMAAAAATVVAVAGLAGAASVALVSALRATPDTAPVPESGESVELVAPLHPDRPSAEVSDRLERENRSNASLPPADNRLSSFGSQLSTPSDSESRHASSVPRHSSAILAADYVLAGPEDVREFLLEWQEALLPLSSAVTQEVGVVALVPDGAEAAAWFASLGSDSGSFPALLLDDLGDAVLTNLDAAAVAAVEADPDYDPAWLLDETLPGIPEEHRLALLPFYDPMLVTLAFDAVPDAARFAELAESGSPPIDSNPYPVPRPLSPVAPPATNAASGGFERARNALGTPPKAASNLEPANLEQAEPAEPPLPPPPPMPDFKLLQRLLYRELVVPFYAGPDGSTHLAEPGAREVWHFALELGRGRLALVPNREWGGAYDLVVRSGVDDPFLRFCAALGAWKWGWTDKARELSDDLAFRLAGDETAFQSLLLAHLAQRFDPALDHAAALREAFAAWRAPLAGEFDRDDIRAWFGHWLVEEIVVATAVDKNTARAARTEAFARRAAEPTPDANPAPGTVPVHEDFVQATFLPLLLREVVAPLEALERDRAAPWRPMALAALRDWCLWTARGEDRPDPLYMGRAVSAAGRGCPWPAIRFLAALKDYDDTAWDPETAVYGQDAPGKTAAAARRVVEALETVDSDPSTTPLARLLMHRAAASRRHPAIPGLSPAAFSAAFFAAVAQGEPAQSGAAQTLPSRTAPEARALWLLAPDTADWSAIATSASDPWLREMALGRAIIAGGAGPVITAGGGPVIGTNGAPVIAAKGGPVIREGASGAFARAAALQPAFPDPWIELLRHCAATPAEARSFYDEAARRELDAPGAADAMLDALRPASLAGAVPSAPAAAEALLAFGDECLATGRFDTKLPFAWARSRFIAASLPGADWEAPFRGAEAITNMNRVCDARLASPLSSRDDRLDAFYARVWPLYANNDFDALVPACDALGAAEGGGRIFDADFDPGHPMRRRALGIAYGLAGYHREDVVAALRHWRIDGDLPAARDAFRACAGCVSSATNAVDNWEQSFVAGSLAVLDCSLARPDDPAYSLLPKAGTPGPRKFWRSREEKVGFDYAHGAWYAGYPSEAAASEPVVPSNAVLSVVVRAWPDGSYPLFWIVPDDTAAFPSPAAVDGLLLGRAPEGGWNLGWARLVLFGGGAVPENGSVGRRVAVHPSSDGTIRIDLRLLDGTVAVAAGDEPLPALSRPDIFSAAAPHAVAFAGHSFELLRADVRVLAAGSAAPDPAFESKNEE